MHNHDLDLVAAYADGSATSADATLAAEWIATCETCAIEFEAQQFALASLANLEPVAMSEIERARLHRGIREAIAEDQLGATPQAAHQPASNRWLKILTGSAAAVLLLVVGFGVILPSLGGSDATSTELAYATSETTAAMATAQAPAAAELANRATAADSAGADMMAAPLETQELGEVTMETLAAMATPIVSSESAGASVASEEPFREEPPETTRESLGATPEPLITCRGEGLSLITGDLLWVGVATLDGKPIEVFRSEAGLIALEAGTCVLVFPAG